jgi:hypothetical protein
MPYPKVRRYLHYNEKRKKFEIQKAHKSAEGTSRWAPSCRGESDKCTKHLLRCWHCIRVRGGGGRSGPPKFYSQSELQAETAKSKVTLLVIFAISCFFFTEVWIDATANSSLSCTKIWYSVLWVPVQDEFNALRTSVTLFWICVL